jgi:putative tryptophan/tyrosine transport system substrate-binding protein
LGADMKRREFVTALGGAAIWPLAARAQQARKIARIGYLAPIAGSDPPIEQAFTEALQRLGWLEGQNITIEYRYAGGRQDTSPRELKKSWASVWMLLLRGGRRWRSQ